MIINTETPDQPEVRDMLARLDAYCAALYPAESNHLMDIESLLQGDVLFLVARDVDGAAVGCAALVNRQEYGEVKRMFVDAEWRGRGVGRALLETLVRGARARGYRILKLGTLDDMIPAQRLYDSLGFTPIDRYRLDELIDTRFYQLDLTK